MKKLIYSVTVAVTLFLMTICFCVTAQADPLTADIPLTQIQSSSTYYSYDYLTKTLTITGEGAVPDFTNSSGSSTSQPWFFWRSDGSVEHIIVEEGITTLGNYCLYGFACNSVSLPSSLRTLNASSMASLYLSSGELILPEGLVTISSSALQYLNGVSHITIPSTVTSIGISAFESCYNLASVDFADLTSVVTISNKAFFKCSVLTSITLPKNATLGQYSVGFYHASRGSVNESTVMRVFKNSAAHTYAKNNFVNYELIEKIPVFEGDFISSRFTDNDLNDVFKYSFIPEVSAVYQFFSVSDIDVYCQLFCEDTLLAENDDVSNVDTDFYISHYLTAGEEYIFVVGTNHFSGDFEVNLIPTNVTHLSCSVSSVELSAAERSAGKFDVLSKLAAAELSFTFDTGYQGCVTVGDGAYRSYCPIEYSDNQYSTYWQCGEHTAYVGIGGAMCEINVKINHFYDEEIVDPEYDRQGYTIYTCISCGDTYLGNYTNSFSKLVKGRVVLMQSPDGSHTDNLTLFGIELSVDGARKKITAIDGEFEFRVASECEEITFSGPCAVSRSIPLNALDGVVDLGDVAIINFDFHKDGYINAKDYAVIRSIFGIYGSGLYDIIDSVDFNHDGRVDDGDWLGAGATNFFVLGKLDSSAY